MSPIRHAGDGAKLTQQCLTFEEYRGEDIEEMHEFKEGYRARHHEAGIGNRSMTPGCRQASGEIG